MNKTKSSGIVRLVAFFLVTVVLVCAFGFSADGWKFEQKGSPSNETLNSEGNNNLPMENLPNTEDAGTPDICLPEYTSYLTGLEITEEQASKRPVAFVIDGSSPLYGTSLGDVLVELPVENGVTRIVSITSDLTNAWKIGSLAQTRGYISNVGNFFDTIIASTGNDDSIIYNSCDTSKDELLLSVENTYCYSEYSYYLYANVNLINSAINAFQINQNKTDGKKSPFIFVDYKADEICGDTKAETVSVVYSANVASRFDYSDKTGVYTMSRNGNINNDLLNNSSLDFKNCFVLFADSVTYEGTSGAQTVMNTIGSGEGYYFTNGSAIRIKWCSDADGNLMFSSEDGSELKINRGKSYIGFVKSSRPDFVSFS